MLFDVRHAQYWVEELQFVLWVGRIVYGAHESRVWWWAAAGLNSKSDVLLFLRGLP